MDRISALILVAVLLTGGCAKTKIVKEPVEVRVPVPVPCPSPPPMELPYLPIEALTEESRPEDVAKAYAESVEILKQHLREAYELLEVYREPPERLEIDSEGSGPEVSLSRAHRKLLSALERGPELPSTGRSPRSPTTGASGGPNVSQRPSVAAEGSIWTCPSSGSGQQASNPA